MGDTLITDLPMHSPNNDHPRGGGAFDGAYQSPDSKVDSKPLTPN